MGGWRFRGMGVCRALALTVGLMGLCRPAAADPPAAPLRVMPLGDSITEGPYRFYLQQRLQADGFVHGVDFDFVGSQSGTNDSGQSGPWEGSGSPWWDKDHQGHGGGFCVDQLLTGVNRWGTVSQTRWWGMQAHRAAGHWNSFGGAPDIVLLQAGVNDIFHYHHPTLHENNRPGMGIVDATLQDFDDLLAWLRQCNPSVKVVLSTGTPSLHAYCTTPQENLADLKNALIAAHAAGRFDAPGSPVVLVDAWSGFDAATMLYRGDGLDVHPNPAGMSHLADVFASGLEPLLVPEPCTVLVLLLGPLALRRRRVRR